MKTFNISIFLIRIYQVVLSPYLGGRCRYYPSCSNYAVESFERFHFFKALLLTLKRVGSCHPLAQNKNYYDPVPHRTKGIS